MIFGFILNLLGDLLGWLATKFSVASDLIPFSGSLSDTAGEYLGPFNSVAPLDQMADMLILLVAGWLPGVILFQLAEWAYRHIPMIGAG